MKYPQGIETCWKLEVIDHYVSEVFEQKYPDESLTKVANYLNVSTSVPSRGQYFEDLGKSSFPKSTTSIEKPPTLELKQLPGHLRYAYLGESSTLPIIISASLTENEEEKLLRVLREHKEAIWWSISDIKCISHSFYMHKILMEENYRPSIEYQRRLNPHMKEVVRAEVIKLLDAGIIYPISDSPWVSPVQVVPKKGGITVI